MNEQFSSEQTTVNGVPVKNLSAVGQILFQKIVALKKESDELVKLAEQKQAALKELSNILLEEVSAIKAAQEAQQK